MNTHEDSHHIITTLAHSPVYQDYERAFNETTGLPVNQQIARLGGYEIELTTPFKAHWSNELFRILGVEPGAVWRGGGGCICLGCWGGW